MKLKLVLLRLLNWLLNTKLVRKIKIIISYLHCMYADWLADQNGHWYKVFCVGWKFRILNMKEIDNRKLNDIRYAKRVLRIKHAKIHAQKDFEKYCIHTARPKDN